MKNLPPPTNPRIFVYFISLVLLTFISCSKNELFEPDVSYQKSSALRDQSPKLVEQNTSIIDSTEYFRIYDSLANILDQNFLPIWQSTCIGSPSSRSGSPITEKPGPCLGYGWKQGTIGGAGLFSRFIINFQYSSTGVTNMSAALSGLAIGWEWQDVNNYNYGNTGYLVGTATYSANFINFVFTYLLTFQFDPSTCTANYKWSRIIPL